MWHTGTGKIIYDPPRGGMKHKTQWWCVVDVDREITRYYRWWIEKQLHVKRLFQPSWDAHISVIRGEKPTPELMHLWKKYDRQVVEFKYMHCPRETEDGEYWFIEVDCPLLVDIRKEFNRPHDWKMHITVGRIWL